MATASLPMVPMAWAMAMARGLLRLMPGTVMVASMAMDSQPMVPMEDMAFTERRRGLLMLTPKPSHGTDMAASTAMDSLPMVPMVWTMVMARGLLMPRLMPGTDMAASMAMDSLLMVPMAAMPTVMARGLLMPKPSPGTVMVASTAMDSAMAMAAMATESNLPPL